ncbi:MAG: iron hydrogenase small subunit, partial [Oscillospiraceae bacterium]|nr:iron hydrogenase small subunit [Oscillospiraceae bacterium]
VRNFVDLKSLRAAALYRNDEAKTLRKSHLNPVVKEIYETYLGEFGSHKAHEILHTTYKKRSHFWWGCPHGQCGASPLRTADAMLVPHLP